jgi:NAD+ synthase (glutamine-hydrolysing)
LELNRLYILQKEARKMALKIACGQMEIIAGRPDLNTQKMLQLIGLAKNDKVDILLFPEMAVPGSLIGDLWEQSAFLKDCEAYGQQVIAATQGITVVFGNVAVDWKRKNKDGHVRKYNAAFTAQDGKLIATEQGLDYVAKTSLPAYRLFDDPRYFSGQETLLKDKRVSLKNGMGLVTVTLHGQEYKMGLLLCEDGWTDNYPINVPVMLKQSGADILCNLSNSPFTLGKNSKRHALFGSQAKELQLPVIYCNNTGIQNTGKNIYTFDGQSCVYGPDGMVKAAAPMFEEKLLTFSWDREHDKIRAYAAEDELIATEDDDAEILYKTIRYGTSRFLKQTGIKRMVLGASGGIDSAVTAALFTDILGPHQVLLVNMPSRYNSELTKNLAQNLAENLGCCYTITPINESVSHTVEQLYTPIHNYTTNRDFKVELTGLMYENIQARDRGSRILAGFSAAFKGGISCNANKAEITVGYGTFYGDLIGLFCPLGDLWKHQVYALGKYLNESVFKRNVIPEQIFTIRPSAELSQEQTVGNGGDPLVYEYHDYLLRAFVENWDTSSPAEILKHYIHHDLEAFLGCRAGILSQIFHTHAAFCKDLERWYGLFTGLAVAKRIQAPPILSLSKRAFGTDYREAQLTTYYSLEYKSLKEKLLVQERLF